MSQRRHILVETKLKRDPDRRAPRLPNVPASVRNRLGAQVDDTLVWAEGSMFVVERASLKPGGYFVVWCERAPMQEGASAGPDTVLEPFATVVDEKLREGGGG